MELIFFLHGAVFETGDQTVLVTQQCSSCCLTAFALPQGPSLFLTLHPQARSLSGGQQPEREHCLLVVSDCFYTTCFLFHFFPPFRY